MSSIRWDSIAVGSVIQYVLRPSPCYNSGMRSIQFQVLPAPEILQNDVECFAIAHNPGEEALAIKQCPNGLPGIVFQHHQGRSAVGSVVTPSGLNSSYSRHQSILRHYAKKPFSKRRGFSRCSGIFLSLNMTDFYNYLSRLRSNIHV
jgi:hypothetical protein